MQTVLSASRRTDIPAHYLDWFLDCLRKGEFRLANPFSGKVRRVSVSRKSVHSIVFWSKDYGRLIRSLGELGSWPLVFNFTLNTHDTFLEPGLPPLTERMSQMRTLAGIYGARAVRWRFDPVVFYEREGRRCDNLGGFEKLLDHAAGLGLKTCTVSFMDPYRKIAARERKLPNFRFIYPEFPEMKETACRMAGAAAARGISLLTCCEDSLARAGIDNLAAGACIDHHLLTDLYGGQLSGRADPGQRRESGCLCRESVDLGSYRGQPCLCGCLYCYANPLTRRRTN